MKTIAYFLLGTAVLMLVGFLVFMATVLTRSYGAFSERTMLASFVGLLVCGALIGRVAYVIRDSRRKD